MLVHALARAHLGMALAGTLAVVALYLDVNWAAAILGLAYGLYMMAFALNLGEIAAPLAAELDRIRVRFRPDSPPVSVRGRRIQAALLAIFGLVIGGLGVAAI